MKDKVLIAAAVVAAIIISMLPAQQVGSADNLADAWVEAAHASADQEFADMRIHGHFGVVESAPITFEFEVPSVGYLEKDHY